MLHDNHAHHHLLLFSLGVLLLGAAMGGVTALLGEPAMESATAGSREREERILRSVEGRRLRREQRLERAERRVRDIGRTYPMEQMSSLVRDNLSRKWDVALDRGFLSYPSLGIKAPVGKPSPLYWKQRNWRALEEQMQFGLLHGVVAYPHSPSFGEKGNIIIAGHSSAPNFAVQGSAYEEVFAALPGARIGDRVKLWKDDDTSYLYEVYDTAIVPATETSILLQDESVRGLVLFTCYPVGTTKDRFVVWARLAEPERNVASL